MKIVVAMDSFKGSLTAFEACDAVKEGLRKLSTNSDIIELPLADGGEGFSDILGSQMGGERVVCEVHNPLMSPVEASYWVVSESATAIIDVAAASELTLLTEERRNPMVTTTYGTGELICDAIGRGCKRIILGLGGSATNDAAAGILSALGCRFYDSKGEEIRVMSGDKLSEVKRVDMTNCIAQEVSFQLAVDVDATFCGTKGAVAIFAPQKGATSEMLRVLEAGMENMAGVIEKHSGRKVADMKGAGAAGGISGGMYGLLPNVSIVGGCELVMKALRFDETLHGASLVVTGEGKFDRQSLMGKVVGRVVAHASKGDVPIVVLAGTVDECDKADCRDVAAVYAITPPDIPLSTAMERDTAYNNLRVAASKIKGGES